MKSNILENVKIIKRHSPAGIIIGLLGLLAIATPAIFFILPWCGLGFANAPSGTYAEGSYLITALDLIKFLIQMPTEPTAFAVYNAQVVSSLRSNIFSYYLVIENLYAASVWLILSALFGIIIFISSIVILIRGKLNHPGGLVAAMFFQFIFNGFLFGDSIRMVLYFQYAAAQGAAASSTEMPLIAGVYWPAIIAAGASFVIWFISWICYLAGFRNKYYKEDIIFVDVGPNPFEKQTPSQRNTLPNSVTSIGGHEYAKNVTLEIANIPLGIKELGQGAFSNCINLKVVSIPTSVKRIGNNCFFNTGKLRRINYGGTKEDWRHIRRGSNWLEKSGTTTVLCRDGAISVNPKH